MKFTLSDRGSLATLSRVRVHSQDTLSGTECAHLELGLEVRGHRQGGNQCIEVPLYVRKNYYYYFICKLHERWRGKRQDTQSKLPATSSLPRHSPWPELGQAEARSQTVILGLPCGSRGPSHESHCLQEGAMRSGGPIAPLWDVEIPSTTATIRPSTCVTG